MNWQVKTKNLNNEVNTFYIDSNSKEEVKKEIQDNYIISIKRNYELIKRQLTYKQLKEIVDEWISLLNAGFDELTSLKVVKDSAFSKLVKTILDSVLLEVQKGNSLENAFLKHEKYFPLIFLDVLKISIESNDLINGLLLISDFLGEQIKNKDKMKNMTLYPKLIGIIVFVVICILSKFIIPSYVDLFKGNNIELNSFSEFLINLFIFIGDNLFYIIGGIFIVFVLSKLLRRAQKVKSLLYYFKTKIPFINKSIMYLNTYLFCSMTNLLWLNNVNKTESLLMVAKSTKDPIMKYKLNCAYSDIHTGLTISESLIKNKIFDNVLIKMFVIGEKNNMMQKNIENAVKYYRYKYQIHLKSLITIIEPLMLVFISLFVLIIILVVFMPMMNAFKMVK